MMQLNHHALPSIQWSRSTEASGDSELPVSSGESELTKRFKGSQKGQRLGEPKLELFSLRKVICANFLVQH